jgi:hypothetical protein
LFQRRDATFKFGDPSRAGSKGIGSGSLGVRNRERSCLTVENGKKETQHPRNNHGVAKVHDAKL